MRKKKTSIKKINLGATSPSRRNFLRNGSAAMAALATTPLAFAGGGTRDGAGGGNGSGGAGGGSEKMIGIQIGATSFMDEGVDKVLDIIQTKGAVNTVFVSTFCYDRGLNGRQMPGHPFPDHGPAESDKKFYHGGNYATPHAKFYEHTAIKGDKMKAPDFGDSDILQKLIPAAKKRGIKVYASVLDSFDYPDDVRKNISEYMELDLAGNKGQAMCFYKPDVKAFWKAVVTDICSSYDIDGVLFFNERNGPLTNTIGANFDVGFHASRITCFCDDHKRAAAANNIDFERAKEGYRRLDALVQRSLKDVRPTDGYYVEFERLILNYPEMVAYHQIFDHGKHEILRDVKEAVKAVNSNLQVGFHIEHENSFNPFYRATRNYEDLATRADFLKVVAYNNAGGERYASFIRTIGSTMFRDVPLEELMRFNNHLLNYGNEASLDQLPAAGLSADYVYRETRRAMEGAKGKCRILTGVDVNIPINKASRFASPDDTYQATLAAMKANGDGVILSRKYSEMMLANLEAAGRAVREGLKA
ncbi:MAG TPA: hypothetical protein VGN00_25550 [Puia sp.]|jgi:hypothetical protein